MKEPWLIDKGTLRELANDMINRRQSSINRLNMPTLTGFISEICYKGSGNFTIIVMPRKESGYQTIHIQLLD